MALPPVLLIELLAGLGADAADAAERLRTMRRAGLDARVHALAPPGGRVTPDTIREVRERVAAERPGEVWIAGPHAAWRALGAVLPPSLPRAWWPTLVPGTGGEPRPSAPAELVALADGTDGSTAALDLAFARRGRERPPVALWDGEFVLVPGALTGDEGARLVQAFARAAAHRPQLELVVLADPDERGAALARAAGVAWRVHAAGAAPREAEHAWLATAAAVLLPASQSVSAGLVLRALAHGTPLALDRDAPGTAWLAAWLAERGLAPGLDVVDALEAALVRAPGVRAALARGREFAARHEPDALGLRLASWRGRDDGRARVAA